jgi:hypothetical protein
MSAITNYSLNGHGLCYRFYYIFSFYFSSVYYTKKLAGAPINSDFISVPIIIGAYIQGLRLQISAQYKQFSRRKS